MTRHAEEGRCICTGVGCWHRGHCTAWDGQPHPRTREPVVLDITGWCQLCAPRPGDYRKPPEPADIPLFD
ncbi:hypothetical protein ABZ801_01230 [Actinomadura sp. NPDC047616]|uniref:hypothetical protein n=1 Tax=Actinomadura sp. NPDC047616 TaxID=3155914 RepID=UPI0033E487F0